MEKNRKIKLWQVLFLIIIGYNILNQILVRTQVKEYLETKYETKMVVERIWSNDIPWLATAYPENDENSSFFVYGYVEKFVYANIVDDEYIETCEVIEIEQKIEDIIDGNIVSIVQTSLGAYNSEVLNE